MDNDIYIKKSNYNFNARATAIITFNDKILLQKRINDNYWALPGGKIKIGETSLEAIYRELFEELNITNIHTAELIDITEYFFKISQTFTHQYIFTYDISLTNYKEIIEENFAGKEKDLLFKWFSLKNIDWTQIKPDYLSEQLVKTKKKSPFRIKKEVK